MYSSLPPWIARGSRNGVALAQVSQRAASGSSDKEQLSPQPESAAAAADRREAVAIPHIESSDKGRMAHWRGLIQYQASQGGLMASQSLLVEEDSSGETVSTSGSER